MQTVVYLLASVMGKGLLRSRFTGVLLGDARPALGVPGGDMSVSDGSHRAEADADVDSDEVLDVTLRARDMLAAGLTPCPLPAFISAKVAMCFTSRSGLGFN